MHDCANYHTFDRGDSRIFQKGLLVGCAWQDNKALTVLSTTSQPVANGSVLRCQKNGVRKPVNCPDSIIVYNKHMGGVDRGTKYEDIKYIRGGKTTKLHNDSLNIDRYYRHANYC